MELYYFTQQKWLQALLVCASVPSSSSQMPEHVRLSSVNSLSEQKMKRYEAFFWQHERQIIAYLYQMTGDEQTAFDLSQETFLRAWQHFDGISAHTNARAWLYRVATNLAHHFFQQRSSSPQSTLNEMLPGESDPGNKVAERELVKQTLQLLTPKQRSTLLLFEVYGVPCDEIAHMLRVSREVVRVTLFRARAKFRAHYLREGGEQ